MMLFTGWDLPYASPGANVQDMLRPVPDGSEIELTAAKHLHHRMLHILALLLNIIVGKVVVSFSELVITAAIFVYIVAHAVSEGCRRVGGSVRAVAVIGCEVVAVNKNTALFG